MRKYKRRYRHFICYPSEHGNDWPSERGSKICPVRELLTTTSRYWAPKFDSWIVNTVLRLFHKFSKLNKKTMQIATKPSRRRFIKLGGNLDPGQYPHNLQFYSAPPTENISLAEFEDFAVERLRGILSFHCVWCLIVFINLIFMLFQAYYSLKVLVYIMCHDKSNVKAGLLIYSVCISL